MDEPHGRSWSGKRGDHRASVMSDTHAPARIVGRERRYRNRISSWEWMDRAGKGQTTFSSSSIPGRGDRCSHRMSGSRGVAVPGACCVFPSSMPPFHRVDPKRRSMTETPLRHSARSTTCLLRTTAQEKSYRRRDPPVHSSPRASPEGEIVKDDAAAIPDRVVRLLLFNMPDEPLIHFAVICPRSVAIPFYETGIIDFLQ